VKIIIRTKNNKTTYPRDSFLSHGIDIEIFLTTLAYEQ